MVKSLLASVLVLLSSDVAAFSVQPGSESKATAAVNGRRSFLATSFASVVGGTSILTQLAQPSFAGPEIITTESGIKYAVTKPPTAKKPVAPLKGECILCYISCDVIVYTDTYS